jgi:hypothetical protein
VSTISQQVKAPCMIKRIKNRTDEEVRWREKREK